MNAFRDRFEHHLLLRMGGAGIAEARAYLAAAFPSATRRRLRMHARGGQGRLPPPLRRGGRGGALPRGASAARSRTSSPSTSRSAATTATGSSGCRPRSTRAIEKKLYYGHFFCHVFHQDYVVKKGHDCLAIEHAMWKLLDERGAEYPAEHNVGHLYQAKPALADFYRSLDPTNSLNPGVGQTSKCAHWHRAAPLHVRSPLMVQTALTIADLKEQARRRVPKMFFDYADCGAWTEGTYRANEADFAEDPAPPARPRRHDRPQPRHRDGRRAGRPCRSPSRPPASAACSTPTARSSRPRPPRPPACRSASPPCRSASIEDVAANTTQALLVPALRDARPRLHRAADRPGQGRAAARRWC